MRNFDLWQNNFDQDGKFLHGKILFTERDSSGGVNVPNKKEIYDEDGTPISNPVLTDTYGKTERQVFLGDGEYTVWRYRYIGGGDFSDYELVNDDSLWELVDSFDICDKYSELQIELDESKCVKVDTVEDLKALDPELVEGETRVVWLLGYNAKGDKRPVAYRSVSSGTPDGGSIIRSTADNTVYWKLLNPTNYVDVRDFGVFPDETNNVGQIANAINYANANGLDVYFPAGGYELNGGSYRIYGMLLVDQGVIFTGKNGTSTNITADNGVNPDTGLVIASQGTGYIVVTVPEVRTSWLHPSGTCHVSATDTLVIDQDVELSSFWFGSPRKCIVTASSTKAIAFKDCEIECSGKLSSTVAYTFNNCNFTDKFFVGGAFSENITITNCRLDINDFASVDNWAKAMLMNGATQLDFQGKLCSELSIVATASDTSYKVLNGSFTKLSFMASYASPRTSTNVLSIENCSIAELDGDYCWGAISISNSDVVVNGSRQYQYSGVDYYDYGLLAGSVSIKKSNITCSSNYAVGTSNSSYIPDSVSIADSVISGIVFAGTVTCVGSIFYNTVKNWENDTVMSVTGCTLYGDSHLETLGTSAVIVDNVFMQNGTPENAVVGNSLTSCVYNENSGNCLKKKVKFEATAAMSFSSSTYSGHKFYALFQTNNDIDIHLFGVAASGIRVRYSLVVSENDGEYRYKTVLESICNYTSNDPRSFFIPHAEQSTTPKALYDNSTDHYKVSVEAPDSVTLDVQNIEACYIEAEIIE